MIASPSGVTDPNTNWFYSRYLWFSYGMGVLLLHLILLCIPPLDVPSAWTLTNIIHNGVAFLFLHVMKGAPWNTADQDKFRHMTNWEQIDNETQLTIARKFLTVVPIFLFFLASLYSEYDSTHFLLNLISLATVLIPKLPAMHRRRLFGINKY